MAKVVHQRQGSELVEVCDCSGAGGNSTIVENPAVLGLPEYNMPGLYKGATGQCTVTSKSGLVNGQVTAFILDVPSLGISNKVFNASSNKATIQITVPANHSQNSADISISAKDNYGNITIPVKQTVAIIDRSRSLMTIRGIDTPVISSPAVGTTVSGGVALVGSKFSGTGETHKSSDWQIARDSAFTQIYAEALNSSDLVNHIFDLSNLTGSTLLYGRVRYNGQNGSVSNWSSVVNFTNTI